MSKQYLRKKTASLTLRGFDITAEEAAALVGVEPYKLGNKGDPVKPGVKTILSRSYVIFSLSFPDDYDMSRMLPDLLDLLGGINRVTHAQSILRPEFSEISFDLPAISSEYLQDGCLGAADIESLYEIKAALQFSFF